MATKAGSRWPRSGWAMAASTRGWTMDGPGPRRSLVGGSNSPGSLVTGAESTQDSSEPTIVAGTFPSRVGTVWGRMDELDVLGQRVIFGSSERMAKIPDASIDLFITSPPYWNLKDYGGPPGSLGSSSYERYLDRLGVVWRQCYRKAKPNGVLV